MTAAEFFPVANEAVAVVAERRVREAFSAFDEGDKGFLVGDELKPAITACLGYRPTKYEVDVWLRRAGSIRGATIDGADNTLVMYKKAFLGEIQSRLELADPTDHIRAVFKAFDCHERGFLTVDDLEAVFYRVCPHMPVERVHAMYREVDFSCTGKVDFMHFELIMKQCLPQEYSCSRENSDPNMLKVDS